MMMAVAAIALAPPGAATAAPAATIPPYVQAAVADPARPPADVERDALRKPGEMLAFAELKPGAVVGELLPGGGYFTRLISKAVGPQGRVYAIITQGQAGGPKPPAVNAIAADPAYGNVKVVAADPAALKLPEAADLVWTSLNYHDLHLTRLNLDVAAVDRAIFAALKPGGLFIVIDHAAAPGSGLDIPDKLHRIDPAIVRREAEAAGFKLEAESAALRNPADDHTVSAVDPAIRGHTDQFVYRFRKPK
jgi:predicted methyltransferase